MKYSSFVLWILTPALLYGQSFYFSGGDSASVLLCQNGTVYTTGYNYFGQKGNGIQPPSNVFEPVSGIGGTGLLYGCKQVIAHSSNTFLALSNLGDTVFSWGYNSNGQLGNSFVGNDPMQNNRYPYRVIGINGVGFLTNVSQITVGGNTSYALLKDSTVVAWGAGIYGQLGNGFNLPNQPFPTVVLKGPSDTLKHIVQIAAGDDFALALRKDGTVWGWGNNAQGQLAQNNTLPSNYAIPIKKHDGSALLSGILKITCGSQHAFALSSNDTLWAWGLNSFGQLGINSTITQLLPTYVLNNTANAPLKGVRTICAGKNFSLALLADSSLVAWGDNSYGQLGCNNLLPSLIPTYVLDFDASAPIKKIVDISTGTFSSFAQKSDRSLFAWGNNLQGQLGIGNNFNQLLPTLIFPPCIMNIPIRFAGNISPPQRVCSSNNSGIISLSGHLGNIIQWQISLDSFQTWHIVSHTLPSLNFTNLTENTYYRALVYYEGMLAYTPATSVIVDQISVGGNISNNQTVCAFSNQDTLRLSGYVGNIIKWQSSTNNFLTSTDISNATHTLIFQNLTHTTWYRALIQNGVCNIAYSDTVVITTDNPSVGGSILGSDTVCISSNSGHLSLISYTGNIIRWESSTDNFNTLINPITNTSPIEIFNNLTQNTWYRAVVKNGVCAQTYSNTAFIKIDNLSVGGILTGSDTVCFSSNSGSLSLSGFTGHILRWEFSTDNFTSFINPIMNTTTIQNYLNLTTDTWYRAIVKNGVCSESASSVAQIKVDALSVGGIVNSSSVICTGINSGTLNLSGYIGSIIRWQNSTDNFNAHINNISNTTPSENYLNLTNTTYYRAIVQNGVCPPVFSSTAILTITQNTVGGTLNSPATVCAGFNSGTLNLTGQTGAVVHWEVSSDNFVSNINTIANTSSSLNYSNIVTSLYYRVLVQNGPCPSQYSSHVLITVDAPTNGGIVSSSDTVCSGSNGGILTLSGHNGTILGWQQSTDNFSTVVNPLPNTSTIQLYLNLTTTLYFRVEVKNGVCPPAYSTVAQIKVDFPSVGGLAGPSKAVCTNLNSDSISLSGFYGTILRWEYSEDNFSTSIVPIANTSFKQYYSGLTTTTYYRAVVQNGVCPTTTSTVATIFITPQSNGGTLSFPDTVCDGFNSGNIFLSSHVGAILRWESSIDNFVSQITQIANTTPIQSYLNLSNTTSYRVLVRNGSCPPVYSPILNITVNPNSNGGNITGSDTVCTATNSGTLTLTGHLGTIIQWEASTDNFATVIVPIHNTSDIQNYSNLTSTTYFRAQIQNAICPIAYSNTAIIKVDQHSVGGTINSPAVVCAGANNGTLNLSGHIGSIIHWETSNDNFISNIDTIFNNTSSQNYTNLNQTTFYRAVIQNGSCPSTYSNTIAITVNPGTVPGFISGTKEVCSGINAGTLVLNSFNGNILRWEYSFDNFSGSKYNIINFNDTIQFFNLSRSRYYRALVQFAPCPPAYSDTFLVLANPPSQGGILKENKTVTTGYNTGTLELIEYTGQIQHWEKSTNNFFTWDTLNINTPTYSFTNIDSTTWFRVVVKSGVCENKYSSIVKITTEAVTRNLLQIYPTISPNEDGINDEWIIDNIHLFPYNKIQIFNRWGTLVYSESGYDNVQRVWRGQSNTNAKLLGNALPEGTYYYIVDPGTGEQVFSGYVVLNR